ncbi:probable L-cysteine desulfhydrase, chloroplastic isoform X2 [Acanthaster planci]|uniref:Probable L-cysteine desulfhydrase, chloroplastic isoform X2 n=1 Tax=Acanthaster planci TaxID=133434 RepID=A0A8B7ZTV4_ACAPL|nr:probable L-cysteine desulfhydrase, chloroplastic isoform X2 [Acanthaster planci]
MSAKRDFGSFHSSNVEELISVSEVDYVPPELPADLPNFTNYRADPTSLPSFGLEMKKRHFLLEEECTFLNHGAFGAVLKEALTASQKWQIHIERQPLRFFDRESLPQLVHVVRRLAKFVGCNPTKLVLVPNVTTAINCVVKSLNFKQGDVIYCLNVTYGAVKKLLSHVAETTGAVIQTERITFPLVSKEQIVETVKKSLKAGTRLAVFDHVPSNTAYIQPIKELIDICHGRGVPVLIDGAHTLGALPLALDALGADFYTSNAHKWFCNPKGCGFLHVGREWRDAVRPLVVSHGWGSGFSSEFMWSGLRDYSPFLALHTVLDFWEAVGVDKIRQYNHQLLCSAAQLLMEEWNTGLLAPLEMCGSMALVQLPPHIAESKTKNYNAAELIQNKLYHEFNIEVPIKAVDGKLYVRISTHIYNELAEYQQLATAIKSIQT